MGTPCLVSTLRRRGQAAVRSSTAQMLHITNGESTRLKLQPSGVPGEIVSWDDILYEGPTPLAAGEAWFRTRAAHLASAGYGSEEELLVDFLAKGDPLAAARRHDEVVFWFEH